MTPSLHSTPSLFSFALILVLTLLGQGPTQTQARKPHIINFRSPNLYPEGITWDPSAQHFIVGSARDRTLVSVSDAGVAETLIFDTDLPENVTILGLAIDSVNNRLLAAIHAIESLPRFDALAAYDLRTRRRVFLSMLPSDGDDVTHQTANAVAVDFKGNAYVTNSIGNHIWKVNDRGEASIFSKSPVFSAQPVNRELPFSFCGLNGIVYSSKGYLLVVQSNTGKMFKVNEDDGKARLVLLNEDMPMADGMAIRRDGVVLVNSAKKVWMLKSDDSWGQGVVFEKIDLDEERFPTSLTVGNDRRVYVVYGHVLEAFMGNWGRDNFGIEEVMSVKENEEDSVWIYVLIGLGLAYFMFWRFQMRQLITNVNKKTN